MLVQLWFFNQIIVMNGLEVCMWCMGCCDKKSQTNILNNALSQGNSQKIPNAE